MSHAIQYLDYHCSKSEHAILKDINNFAYDPQESSGYHGDLTFHREPVYPTARLRKRLLQNQTADGTMTML